MIDGRNIAERGIDADLPVTTSVYTVVVCMNEEDPMMTDERAIEVFSAEFQRALDAGFFAGIRYDALTYEVASRIPISTVGG